jgi:hypothetical protein
MVNKDTGEIIAARPMTDTLRLIGGGEYMDSVSEKMGELVIAVNATGKPGTIGMKITVKKATRGGAMHITGEVKVTPPAEESMEVMLFATDGGNLVADDPKQRKLDLKSVAPAVETDKAELKRI